MSTMVCVYRKSAMISMLFSLTAFTLFSLYLRHVSEFLYQAVHSMFVIMTIELYLMALIWFASATA